MKAIKDMTLTECIDRLRKLPDGTCEDQFDMRDLPWIWDVAEELADRIHELFEQENEGLIAISEAYQYLKERHKWVSFKERYPVGLDGDKILVYDKYNGVFVIEQRRINDYHPHLTHWQRITPPEDKP